jgi:hypothetical protein
LFGNTILILVTLQLKEERKMLKRFLMLFGAFVFLLFSSFTAYASDVEVLMQLLLKKGIINQTEYGELKNELEMLKVKKEELKKEVKEEILSEMKGTVLEKESESVSLPPWMERVTLSGTLEGEFRWQDKRDIGERNSDSTSDLYLRRLELGIEAAITDWVDTSLVLNSEWIGDGVNEGDEQITVDEAMVNIQNNDFPFYFSVGKRTQPFGVFENHLITDPMTQDAYETKKVGVTVGYTGTVGLDLSATLYKGEEQMDHLAASGLFDITRNPGIETTDDVDSYILSASLSPVEDRLTLFGSYLSEPGRGDRNKTMTFGFTADIANIMIEGEYMRALKREKYSGISNEYKEGVLSLGVAYALIAREREMVGGALFAERKAHLVSEPLEFALRYERFDDDDFADRESSWSVDNRYSAGVRYSFYHDEKSGLAAYVASEYRHTDYRLHPIQTARAKDNNELYLRLGVSF